MAGLASPRPDGEQGFSRPHGRALNAVDRLAERAATLR